jgi:hypothetical protein
MVDTSSYGHVHGKFHDLFQHDVSSGVPKILRETEKAILETSGKSYWNIQHIYTPD